MRKVFVLFLVSNMWMNVMGMGQAFAYSSGKMKCFFEVYSKKTWPKQEKTDFFDIDVMQTYESSVELESLDNKIRFRYVPGTVASNNVKFAAVTMMYSGADAGADVPLVPDGEYVFKIGRQDSDLVGGFMNCKVQELK